MPGKCGKSLRREWFHTAPDGSVTQCRDLVSCVRMRQTLGGSYKQRVWRE